MKQYVYCFPPKEDGLQTPAATQEVDRRPFPYTQEGLKRCKCVRCGAKASHQWKACADTKYRALCRSCDTALNNIVLTYFKLPNATALMEKYMYGKALR